MSTPSPTVPAAAERRRAKSGIVVELIVSSLLFLASATAFAAPAVNADSPVVQDACRAMGLSPAETPFQACAFSLAETLRQVATSQAISGINGASASRESMILTGIGYAVPSLTSHPTSREAGENSACRQIGLQPGQQGYAQCVANLDAAVQRAEMLPN